MPEVVSFEESLFYGLGTVAITLVIVIGFVYFLMSRAARK